MLSTFVFCTQLLLTSYGACQTFMPAHQGFKAIVLMFALVLTTWLGSTVLVATYRAFDCREAMQ